MQMTRYLGEMKNNLRPYMRKRFVFIKKSDNFQCLQLKKSPILNIIDLYNNNGF